MHQNDINTLCGRPDPLFDWDQKNLEVYQSRLSKTRRHTDKRLLTQIFNLSDEVHSLRTAFRFALENGVRFIVDHRVQNLNGYYDCGTGVVAIAKHRFSDIPGAGGTATHELFHVLQDKERLCGAPQENTLLSKLLNKYVVEAPAMGFGRAAAAQTRLVLEGKDPAEAPGRWDSLISWVNRKNGGAIYGEKLSRRHAQELGMEVEAIADTYDFPRTFKIRQRDAPTLGPEEKFLAMNRDFEGHPWFDTNIAQDFYHARIANPERVARFLGRSEPTPLVREIFLREGVSLSP